MADIDIDKFNEHQVLSTYEANYSFHDGLKAGDFDDDFQKNTEKVLEYIGASYHDKKGCVFTTIDKTTLNNITEYKCVFRTEKDNPIIRTGYSSLYDYDKVDSFVDDFDPKNVYNTNAIFKRFSEEDKKDFPEHWSNPKSNDEKITCKNHAYSYTKQTVKSEAYKDTIYYQGSRTEIQSECRGHILNPEFIEISHDTILKYYNISIGDYNWLVDVLNKRIREKNKSPKYAWNNNNTGIERLNTAQSGNIIKELKELNDILGKMQPEGNDKKTGNRKHDHWIYHSDKLSNETNLIETELITNVFEVVVNNEIQDCICYSDCNGYSVCWCYGNCNYY